ncbi:MAG TPA: stage II sporulation protein R, partial [Clostridia bacterium]|nr:stage II sporulation protein R [Clostridia bacterium]
MKIGYSRNPLSFRAFICAFVLTAAFSVTSFAAAAQSVRGECVRLHILANSDSEKDQELKLKVRDELLFSGSEIFSGSTDIKEVEKKLQKSRNELITAALKVIKDEGFDYKVTINICDEYFTTRSYGRYTMPAGKYKAVKV